MKKIFDFCEKFDLRCEFSFGRYRNVIDGERCARFVIYMPESWSVCDLVDFNFFVATVSTGRVVIDKNVYSFTVLESCFGDL